jgi:hypothetical protein
MRAFRIGVAQWFAMEVDVLDTIRKILQLCAAPVDRCTMPCTSGKSNATFFEKGPLTYRKL